MFINTFFVIFFLSDFFQESGTTASVPGCPGMVHVRALFPTKSRDQMWKILLFPHKFSLLFFIPFFPFVFLLLLHWRPVFLLDTTTQLQEAQGSCNCSQDCTYSWIHSNSTSKDSYEFTNSCEDRVLTQHLRCWLGTATLE